MKILHLPATYLPHTTGGKEVYTHSLAKGLEILGFENHVAIHAYNNISEGMYYHESIPVHVLPAYNTKNKHTSLYTRELNSTEGFEALLMTLKPDIVHFHDQSGGASLTHLQLVKKWGIKAVLTFHSPGQSCPQRALLYKNRSMCNGKHKVTTCTYCQLVNAKVPEVLAGIAAVNPFHFRNEPVSKLQKLMFARNATKLYFKSFHEFIRHADAVQIYAQWAVDMFVANNVPVEKIHFFRTGGKEKLHNTKPFESIGHRPLKIVFAGRCTHIKGVHTLIEAVKMLKPQCNVEVYFLGPYWDDTEYGQQLLKMTEGDLRFKKPYLVPNHLVLEELSKFDIAAIPSLWLETGPIAVFDAFAAGLPVLGSNAGGIAELVENEVNGLLFEPDNALDFSKNIERLICEPDLLKTLTLHVATSTYRTMNNVAKDMAELYKSLNINT